MSMHYLYLADDIVIVVVNDEFVQGILAGRLSSTGAPLAWIFWSG
jgi:hypothetical protein